MVDMFFFVGMLDFVRNLFSFLARIIQMAALWRLCQVLSMRDELSKEAIAEPRQLETVLTQIGKATKARVECEMKTELNPEIKEEPQPKPEIKHEPG